MTGAWLIPKDIPEFEFFERPGPVLFKKISLHPPFFKGNNKLDWPYPEKAIVSYLTNPLVSSFSRHTIGSMAVLLKMPLAVYLAFLGRCPLLSREYSALKNSVMNVGEMVSCRRWISSARLQTLSFFFNAQNSFIPPLYPTCDKGLPRFAASQPNIEENQLHKLGISAPIVPTGLPGLISVLRTIFRATTRYATSVSLKTSTATVNN